MKKKIKNKKINKKNKNKKKKEEANKYPPIFAYHRYAQSMFEMSEGCTDYLLKLNIMFWSSIHL